MNTKTTEDELDLAVEEFVKIFKAFEKAARKLMAIMDNMNKQQCQELKDLFGDSQQTYEFSIQMMDENGHQIGEKCFGIKCMAEKEKKQE